MVKLVDILNPKCTVSALWIALRRFHSTVHPALDAGVHCHSRQIQTDLSSRLLTPVEKPTEIRSDQTISLTVTLPARIPTELTSQQSLRICTRQILSLTLFENAAFDKLLQVRRKSYDAAKYKKIHLVVIQDNTRVI